MYIKLEWRDYKLLILNRDANRIQLWSKTTLVVYLDLNIV